MRQDQTEISVKTAGQALTDITRSVQTFLEESGIETGILTVFCRHTSASLIIQENADADVQRALEARHGLLTPLRVTGLPIRREDDTVIVDGEVVVQNGRSTRIDDDELFAQAEAGAKRAWDNWAARDWANRTVEQIIPPAFPARKN